ncbi:hypothetical protein RB25_26020 [Herbaspirillum rubrisubalbicans]|jgi:GNAT superfamily N-acetyltransferase|uniref:GNAT family N-acetyltransferase n=1 Tax=Herbaspirillum rubrisubalbicans Os34 TaxID=1235827 RepID=A0A6M3ZV51_9BURK|nr:GNAT family N-acetyltransferase [Herbaspirillum rubrisubalbicans]MCP1573966.1 GNAT superfamily N-acetyltransferase [Herbaspirillum rubrisubalbicans]QJQ02416.1 GNAT family N-acetyltransferase [Herbaspirillum rubrisubalbicans Os34]RAN42341.1 hypothetical protein RB25_26020 [Herbaspirillum rubrisubalbicans]
MFAAFIQSRESDLERLVDIRIAAMRESLERVGRFDAQRVRERFTSTFTPETSYFIMIDGHAVGFFSLDRHHDAHVLRHFYILSQYQRRGIGAQVLKRVLADASRKGCPVKLTALRESDANRFYLNNGFLQVGEEEWDIFYAHRPKGVTLSSTNNEIGSIRWLGWTDLPHLDVVLREHVRDLHTGQIVESEIASIKAHMEGGADDEGRYRSYLVACDPAGLPVACMGLSRPDARMSAHVAMTAPDALELLNVFVRRDFMQTKGIGRSLLSAVYEEATAAGASRLLVNSGPRYLASWGFYDHMFDKDHGMLIDYYGTGRHAKVWSKVLQKPGI